MRELVYGERLAIVMSKEMKDFIKKISDKKRASISQIIRDAITNTYGDVMTEGQTDLFKNQN
jgi:hypothetical protein